MVANLHSLVDLIGDASLLATCSFIDKCSWTKLANLYLTQSRLARESLYSILEILTCDKNDTYIARDMTFVLYCLYLYFH